MKFPVRIHRRVDKEDSETWGVREGGSVTRGPSKERHITA